jgi:hypothetical protein
VSSRRPIPAIQNLGALLDANHERHPQGGQQGKERDIGEASICCDPHPPASHFPDNARHGSAHHREFITLHTAFEHRGVIGAPVDGHGTPADNERDDEQMLVPFDRPVDGQPDGPMRRQLDEGWQEHGIRQMARLQPCIVQEPRQPLRRGFLIAKGAGQLGLTAGLLVNNGPDKIPDAFALMAMCPGQHRRDIIVEASSRRVLSSHIPRLA